MARTVFAGFWTALFYAVANKLFALWREVPRLIATGPASAYKNATLTSEITPEYLGVGYIIGPRISGHHGVGQRALVAGAHPAARRCSSPRRRSRPISRKLGFNDGLDGRQQPGQLDLPRLRPLHRRRRRGDGRPHDADPDAADDLRVHPRLAARAAARAWAARSQLRTERDIPITYVAFGSVAMAVLIPLVQKMPVGFPWSLLVSLLIVVFGFFFVAVSSRIVGSDRHPRRTRSRG